MEVEWRQDCESSLDTPSSWSAAFNCDMNVRAEDSKLMKKSGVRIEIYESSIIQLVKVSAVSHGNGTEN